MDENQSQELKFAQLTQKIDQIKEEIVQLSDTSGEVRDLKQAFQNASIESLFKTPQTYVKFIMGIAVTSMAFFYENSLVTGLHMNGLMLLTSSYLMLIVSFAAGIFYSVADFKLHQIILTTLSPIESIQDRTSKVPSSKTTRFLWWTQSISLLIAMILYGLAMLQTLWAVISVTG
ncbi:MAG: hypothetical protein H6606_05965 [Flavobacteriales bacterium]|nr:hypothetical protein [Flavobacteriales bacterium]